ncbi:DUF4191 domain-containing protein [Actinoallomurus rhizosphaericola]|uniref:DUF4191 domain-containing protein n=1 Tax=Actinoallomurus rhizosphaericola TaxID=2952536 RepID=UPI002093EBE2|nr:DUF4191 domain-containing protein [Actinoallomurus rhizosphaericola]MCO5996458.1 DUF4191 domain-containing protein [Actinoallomurus rhizosphaericola]
MPKKPQEGTQDERAGRVKQLRMVASLVHQANPKAMPIVFASALGVLVVFVVLGLLLGQALYLIPLGVLVAILVGMIVFGQMAQRTQYSMLEGRPGAAASLVENMRGRWVVTPAVQANRNMDVVHRVIGTPGVILLSEGPRSRVGKLIGAEKKRISRAASEVPIYDIQVGSEEGQVPIAKLQRHLTRLPRNLKKEQVSELIDRLNALPQAMQMPKGPIPKGVRMPKGPKPRTR